MMKLVRTIFLQTVMITAGIVFLVGLESAFFHFFTDEEMVLDWYHPISFVICGLLGSLPTVVFHNMEKLSKKAVAVRCVLHIILLYAVILSFGWLFKWYTKLRGFIVVSVFFFVIYVFIWGATLWFYKKDDREINSAIDEIRDEE